MSKSNFAAVGHGQAFQVMQKMLSQTLHMYRKSLRLLTFKSEFLWKLELNRFKWEDALLSSHA